MSIIVELFELLGARKKFWLLPLLVLFLIFGGLFVLSQDSVVAPLYLYAFFDEPEMLVLGVSAFYHDSAAALVRDGEIIAAAQNAKAILDLIDVKPDGSFRLNLDYFSGLA